MFEAGMKAFLFMLPESVRLLSLLPRAHSKTGVTWLGKGMQCEERDETSPQAPLPGAGRQSPGPPRLGPGVRPAGAAGERRAGGLGRGFAGLSASPGRGGARPGGARPCPPRRDPAGASARRTSGTAPPPACPRHSVSAAGMRGQDPAGPGRGARRLHPRSSGGRGAGAGPRVGGARGGGTFKLAASARGPGSWLLERANLRRRHLQKRGARHAAPPLGTAPAALAAAAAAAADPRRPRPPGPPGFAEAGHAGPRGQSRAPPCLRPARRGPRRRYAGGVGPPPGRDASGHRGGTAGRREVGRTGREGWVAGEAGHPTGEAPCSRQVFPASQPEPDCGAGERISSPMRPVGRRVQAREWDVQSHS